jgi:hypothetical protein
MKTGRDADRTGLYISECCLQELSVPSGEMLPRCPQCNALTVWELVNQPVPSGLDAMPRVEEATQYRR